MFFGDEADTLPESEYLKAIWMEIKTDNPDALKQIESVNAVLDEIGCGQKPILKVLNKVDIVKKIGQFEMLQTLFADAIAISAKTGFDLERLSEAVTEKYKGAELLLRVASSQSNGRVQSFLRAHGQILKEEYCDSSVLIDARLGRNQLPDLKRLHPETIEIVKG